MAVMKNIEEVIKLNEIKFSKGGRKDEKNQFIAGYVCDVCGVNY
jgi:hypothetical protein